jgi:hypothetical protein
MSKFSCPHCGADNRVPGAAEGASRVCRGCGRPVTAPSLSVQAQPSPVVSGRPRRPPDAAEQEAVAKAQAEAFRARVRPNYIKAYIVLGTAGALFLLCCVLPACIGVVHDLVEGPVALQTSARQKTSP